MKSTLFSLFALVILSSVASVSSVSPPASCGACASFNFSSSICASTAGCMWVPSTNSCQNDCSYVTEEECGIAEASAGCHDQCVWLPGQFNVCRPKNYHFDVCVAVDVSTTMSSSIDFTKNFLKNSIIRSFILPGCDLNNSASPGCPHLAVVTFDHTGRILMPSLTSISPVYQSNQDCCLGPNVTLPRLATGWESTIDSLTVSAGNYKRHTVEGVQRCADLLLNTHRSEPRSLPVLVVITNGVPVGPNRFGESASACDVNPVKIAHTKRGGDPSCEMFPYREVTQNTKLAEAGARTMVVALNSDKWIDTQNKLSCLLQRDGVQVGMMINMASSMVSGGAAAKLSQSNPIQCATEKLKATWFGVGSVVGISAVGLVALIVYFVRKQSSKVVHFTVSVDDDDESVPVKQVGRQISLQDSTYDSDVELHLSKVLSVA